MRKTFFNLCLKLIFLFIFCFSLQGCGSASTQAVQNTTFSERRTGTIQSLGSTITTNQATNLLRLENGGTLLLKSKKLDLNDPKFNKKSVEVSGFINKTDEDNQIMDVSAIDVLNENLEQKILPIWKNFQNNQFGIKFEYPDNFQLKENNNLIILDKLAEAVTSYIPSSTQDISSAELTQITFTFSAHTVDSNLYQFLGLKNDSSSALLDAGLAKTRIGTNSLASMKKNNSDNSTLTYYLDSGSDFLEITMKPKGKNIAEDQDIFYKIINSLELIPNDTSKATESANTLTSIKSEPTNELNFNIDDSTSTEQKKNNVEQSEVIHDYSTFENSSYKFSIQYPKKYYFGRVDSSENSVISSYSFGHKPIEENLGNITLDLLSGALPKDNSTKPDSDKSIAKSLNGETVSFYFKGNGSRVYKLSGPTSEEKVLVQMIQSLKEL